MAPEPIQLRHHYSDFLRPGRILLTGHSHQAWPNVAREGVLQAYLDAAGHVDDKWSLAMTKADRVRSAIAAYLGVDSHQIALGQNSHELVCRFLSALDWSRKKIVTTDGEFHSMSRQLSRLAEAQVEVVWIPANPVGTLAERLAAAVDEQTAAVMVSTVLFQTASVVPHLELTIAAAEQCGAHVLLDAYHAYGALPNTTPDVGGTNAFVTGGGYKYAQWGEGVCWMRVPEGCQLRPVFTGWFSDFAGLEAEQSGEIGYGQTPADRFAGSTYDPISHYRAARVIEFFERQGMDMQALRARSLCQTQSIIDQLDGYEVLTPRGHLRGGFVAVRVAQAASVVRRLREAGIFVDARADILRFGPAPYTTDGEIEHAITTFRSIYAPP